MINEKLNSFDYEKFLSRLDMKWDDLQYYKGHITAKGIENNPDRTEIGWLSSSFMGNGMIGCSVFMDSENVLKFELGRNDVEAHNFLKNIDWCTPRVPIGDILFAPKGKITKHTMRLCLYDAQTFNHIVTTEGEINIKSFVQRDNDIIIIDVKTKGNEELTFMSRANHGISPRIRCVEQRVNSAFLPPMPFDIKINGADVNVQTFINNDLNPEGERAFAYKEYKISENEKIYVISITNSEKDNSARFEAAKLVNICDFESLEKSHKAWWHNYYKKSFLSFSDTRWEAFYWIQMYKFASATDGKMNEALDNQGPWMNISAWPGTWWNLNVQLSYSAMHKANRLETGKSLLNSIKKNSEVLKANAKPLGIDDGMYLSRSTGRTPVNPIPSYDKIMDKDKKLYGFELGDFTWTCFILWRAYRSTMDEKFLMDFYEILKPTINVFLKLTYKKSDGKWHLPKTTSPEYPEPNGNGTSYPCEDTTYDLSLFLWGCKTLLEISDKIAPNEPLRSKWKDIVDNIFPFPYDEETGLRVARDVAFTYTHRHYSHLFPIFPLHLWDVEDKEIYRKAKKSINNFLYDSDGNKRTGDITGYTFTGSSCMLSTLGESNAAYEALNRTREFFQPNTMYVEGGGQVIETPLSASETIHYFFLQCYGDTVKVFPAVPDAIKDVCFANLLAEGAFEITARRENGINLYVYIKSLAGSPLKLKPNLKGDISFISDDENLIFTDCKNGLYDIKMKKGSYILVYTGNTVPEIQISAVKSQKEYENYYGQKRGKYRLE